MCAVGPDSPDRGKSAASQTSSKVFCGVSPPGIVRLPDAMRPVQRLHSVRVRIATGTETLRMRQTPQKMRNKVATETLRMRQTPQKMRNKVATR